MKGRKNQTSENEKAFRPKFRRTNQRQQKGITTPFWKRVIGALAAKKGRHARRYSRGRGLVRKELSNSAQRVIVKARVTKSSRESLAKHLAYIERKGAGREGERGKAFSGSGYLSIEEKDVWLATAKDDRHHFRLIVSPENARELDLEQFAKRFMQEAEHDLNTSLSWLAVVHENTDNPHVHFVVRGVDSEGKDLVIERQYIKSGMRAAAQELATKELGFRKTKEVKAERERSVFQERFTWLDKKLLEMGEIVDCSHTAWSKVLLIGRLEFLRARGLAEQVDAGVWKVNPELESRLRDLGKRGDLLKAVHALSDRKVTPEELQKGESMTGEVIGVGVLDELAGKTQLVIEGEDGRICSAILLAEGSGGFRKGSRVEVSREDEPKRGARRAVLAGFDNAWANVREVADAQAKRSLTGRLAELESEEIEEVTRNGVSGRNSERVRSQFLLRLVDKSRER